jgi:arylformamidase
MAEWIDISYPLSEDLIHWPQDPIPPDIKSRSSQSESGTVTMSQMTTIDKMPLDTIMGPARVIEIKDKDTIKPAELEAHDIRPGERILFKTVNSSYYRLGSFVEDFVHITQDTARYLKDRKISVVGVDYLAVGSFRDRPGMLEVHRILLGAGIWIIEALDLSAVKGGRYEIICLPIRIKNGDAAQSRAIVRPLE